MGKNNFQAHDNSIATAEYPELRFAARVAVGLLYASKLTDLSGVKHLIFPVLQVSKGVLIAPRL